MEYLIPTTAVSVLAPTLKKSLLQKQPSESSLDIHRTLITTSENMSHPKNVKLNNDSNDVCSDENTSSLSVSRHPANANARLKGGNTPHRNKLSKKQLKLAQAQLDKFTQINVHLHGLFSAVEHGHLDKARTILESTDVDVNCINSDGLSTLDVAVLSNNRSMTKMLLQHGAVEASKYSTDSIGTKLNALLKDAESRIHDLSGSSNGQSAFASRPSISSIIIGNTNSSVTGCTGSETDKQIGIWERRVKGLRRVLLGWDQARPPDTPSSITVDVTGDNSLVVHLLEPLDGAIATKFKVQWSTRSDFGNVVGERIILEWVSFHGAMGSECHINGLTQGRRYFIRAMCGNVKGWGPFKTSLPASVVPSSWRDVNNHEDRYVGRQHLLDNLFTAVRVARPADVSELVLDSSSVHRRMPKKKTTIKQLFSVASRFQKNLRRGIYLASIIYWEDKILVTSEDFLPVIEIDESYPSTLHTDYHWLMKVACSWEDVKSLRSDMERNVTSAVHFRSKLLAAVSHMQSALGVTDLGSVFYKPFRDTLGTVVLACVQSVRSQKSISILNSRWLPVSKLQKKIGAIHEDYTIGEKLILSIGEQIHYHQASLQRLQPGLYLGYLKMQCSVEQIQVVVPVKTPNVLPHCKVRENSHINAEEWHVLKRSRNAATGSSAAAHRDCLLLDFNANSSDVTSECQRLFLHHLAAAARKLLCYMNIRVENAATHRLYDAEVIELNKDISFLVICPSVGLTCVAPGQPEILLQNDELISLSVQAFEMVHLRTYQPAIIQKYSRLSCILELDTALANHSHREAFSTSELEAAKERLAKLQELSTNLNAIWKSVRWLMDVIAFARDKNAQPSVAMHEILELAQSSAEMLTDASEQPNLLQLPIRDVKLNKSGSGRGSWPGPVGSSQAVSTPVEHSKSEQNLGRTEPGHHAASESSSVAESQLLHVIEDYKQFDGPLRKSSAESLASEYTAHSSYSAAECGAVHIAIPPSQSADTIALDRDRRGHHQYSAVHRNRTTSNISAGSIQPLPDISISHSVPSLFSKHKTMVTSLSLKTPLTTDVNHTSSGALNIDEGTENPSSTQAKAASSVNMQEGGLYLRSTLSALQSEMKTGADEAQVLKNSSSKSLSHQSSEENSASASSLNSEQTSGIIQVYTAYNTGLASGTSLKLHVTPKTSAREVINLVVKQLNMAAVLKGNNAPIYTSEMLNNFCLVAVIGARERCLRDDFKPLQLQNPWKKGRLYVRQKHELLAAIEHSNRKSQLI